MNIAVTIMAHPKRKEQARALLLQLQQYPFAECSIIWDRVNEEWHTGERALRAGIGRGFEYFCVLQDDAILTPYFYTNVESAIAAVPTKVLISLYTGKSRPLAQRVQIAVDKAQEGDWLQFHMLLWGVGILLPSDHIEPLLDFVNEPRWSDTPYDSRVGVFYQRNMLPIYYTVPSLVDHDDSLSSLLAHGKLEAPRIAHRLAKGRINWNRRVIDI